ncbi:MAG: growth inhibitor PemK [Stellaceae bacterium]
MPLPRPEPGLVVCYEFLWRDEARSGLEYGQKQRPCAIIVAVTDSTGKTETIVAPITHTPPTAPSEGIEILSAIKSHLGLDAAPAWAIVTDLNRFIWPGFDLSPIPGRKPPRYAYGMLPPRFFDRIKRRILAIDARLKSATPRDQRPATGKPASASRVRAKPGKKR